MEAAEEAGDAGEGGFDEGSKGRMPTGTILQFLWFLGHRRWTLSFLSSSRSLSDDDDETESFSPHEQVQPHGRIECVLVGQLCSNWHALTVIVVISEIDMLGLVPVE